MRLPIVSFAYARSFSITCLNQGGGRYDQRPSSQTRKRSRTKTNGTLGVAAQAAAPAREHIVAFTAEEDLPPGDRDPVYYISNDLRLQRVGGPSSSGQQKRDQDSRRWVVCSVLEFQNLILISRSSSTSTNTSSEDFYEKRRPHTYQNLPSVSNSSSAQLDTGTPSGTGVPSYQPR